MARAPFDLAGIRIAPGSRTQIDVPVARLYTHAPLYIPVEVVHGRQEGPTLLVCGGIHGDEINSVEIVRRLLRSKQLQGLRGTLIAAPIVNVFGFITESRYLPDRRDLNRSFPGSREGSLAARIAELFMRQVVRHATHLIDLHTASLHRTNLPQVRGNLKDAETRRCAQAFGAPVMMHAAARDGSLREAAARKGVHVLVYEGGEPHRFNADAIATGVGGIQRVMAALGMVAAPRRKATLSREVHSSTWVRAHQSGVLRLSVRLGQEVHKNQVIASIADVFGENPRFVRTPMDGIVIGLTNDPRAHRGDAVAHVAAFDQP